MASSDPIADLLTIIRNGGLAKRRFVDVDWSKIKQNIVEILKQEGFIEDYLLKKESPQRGKLRVFLKYRPDRVHIIKGLKRISKPGLRRYVAHLEIPYFFGGYGVSIISTSKGLMVGRQAIEQKVGGELLCAVW